MLLSREFLRRDYGLDWDAAVLAESLTMAGLEVDGIEKLGEALSGVVVAEILALQPHPDADKLRIAEVNDGRQRLQIVCGAPNVAAGIKVPLAQIGAELPGGVRIKKSKLRGVESQGMLCSARELGLPEDVDGLLILPPDAPLGVDIKDYLQLPDSILDINITPNRADCFSWRGLAREIHILGRKRFPEAVLPPLPTENIATDEALPAPQIAVTAPEACPYYSLRRLSKVDNRRPTPPFIRLALERAGMKTHSPVVDVTNYVMLQLGTPLHAFDAAGIQEPISVRWAQPEEPLQLLNGQRATLDAASLVIADREKALALAGVMGGLASASQVESREFLLESAWFAPTAIAGRARQYNLSSDSAQRFERGVDDDLQRLALDWATALILSICGGSASAVASVESPEHRRTLPAVHLRWDSIPKRLGRDYAPETVRDILVALGCQLEALPDGLRLQPPRWRFDLNEEVDFIEEIARIDGYQHIESRLPPSAYQPAAAPDARRRFSDALVALGFNEAICYSFIAPEWQQAFMPQAEALRLQNPISAQLAIMRRSLLPGLLQALQYNRHRQQTDVRLFEWGRVFHSLEEQPYAVAGVLSGLAQPEQWQGARPYDFYDVKAVVEALLAPRKAEFRPSAAAFMHPHQSADIYLDGLKVGLLGVLHPSLLQQLGIKGGAVLAFELQPERLAPLPLVEYRVLPRFPGVRRDLALLVAQDVPVEALLAACREGVGELLQQVFCFDVYRHERLGERQSVALALLLQAQDRTLQDGEVDAIISSLVKDLSQKFKAELR